MMRLDISTSPSKDDIAVLRLGLSEYNVAQVPELMTLSDREFLVFIREEGKIVAGAVCEFDWGWLYFDAVWTDESVRGKGYGKRIMNAAESYAAWQGVNRAYLMTTSFQARPFYEKLGYDCFGSLEDFPPGHTFYYMKKEQLETQPINPRVTIETPPIKESLKVIDDSLLRVIAKTAPLIYQNFGIFLRDEEDTIMGGLLGGSFWDWFSLRFLWVDESLQGQGWGKKLLATAETEIRKQGCIGIHADTASFQSLPFYQSQGFSITGELENRPPGHRSYFIQKRFA